MTASLEEWHAAQAGEAEYWRRAPRGVRSLRAIQVAMLEIMPQYMTGRCVIDVGAGPESAVVPLAAYLGPSTVLDPLIFNRDDENSYTRLGIERIIGAAEDFTPWLNDGAVDSPFRPWDEAWCYNCLQHTRDPDLVLEHLTRYAHSTIRLFEWIGVPTDRLHLHTLTRARLMWPFHEEWRVAHEIEGEWRESGFSQKFLAVVLHRK